MAAPPPAKISDITPIAEDQNWYGLCIMLCVICVVFLPFFFFLSSPHQLEGKYMTCVTFAAYAKCGAPVHQHQAPLSVHALRDF